LNLEELDASTKAKREHHVVVFLPFVRLKMACTVAGVEFVPLRDGDDKVPDTLLSAVDPLERILSGYIDRHGDPLTNCVVATIPGRGWDLEVEDFPTVRWAASLLFLASWSCNDYYPRFSRDYVNSTNFRMVGQRYTGATPGYIAVSARRRDGSTTDGGYEHGEFKFSVPLQISVREPASIDEKFLNALDAAQAAGSTLIERLQTALPFVELANSDDDFMTEQAEAILMGSAFEQLLHGDASAYKLSKKFGELFKPFGSVTVADALKVRSGIQLDTSTPEIAAAQPTWWVHRKWIEELYDVRSKVVHKGSEKSRAWGWEIGRHRVMAAHLFPLTVELLVEKEGHYALTDEDRAACLATDLLLVSPQWVEDRDDRETGHSWHEVIEKTTNDLRWEKIWEKVKKEHPEVFRDDASQMSDRKPAPDPAVD